MTCLRVHIMSKFLGLGIQLIGRILVCLKPEFDPQYCRIIIMIMMLFFVIRWIQCRLKVCHLILANKTVTIWSRLQDIPTLEEIFLLHTIAASYPGKLFFPSIFNSKYLFKLPTSCYPNPNYQHSFKCRLFLFSSTSYQLAVFSQPF